MRDAPMGSRGGYGFGLSGPVPRDVWILLGVVFTTFSMRFFSATAAVPAVFELTPAAWRNGFLWQLLTYPFVGTGAPGIWFVLELVIVFLFARTVYYQLGRRKFWRLLFLLAAAAGAAAILVDIAGTLLPSGRPWPVPYALLQGQRMLLVLLVALFAVLNRQATILLFFVLPIQARWFLLLEIVVAFLGFLSTKDFPGFVGICVAVGCTVWYFRPGLGPRGLGRALKEIRLRIQAAWFRLRLSRLKQRRGMRVVRGDKKDDWIH